MNHRYALALKLDDWTADTQNIGIQHLSIGRTSSWNKPIVNWVDKPMVRMLRTQRPVYLDRTILFRKSLESEYSEGHLDRRVRYESFRTSR